MWGFAHLAGAYCHHAPQKGKSGVMGANAAMVLGKPALPACVSSRASAHQALVTPISLACDFSFTKWSPAISHALE
jgi:hypothetical protein